MSLGVCDNGWGRLPVCPGAYCGRTEEENGMLSGCQSCLRGYVKSLLPNGCSECVRCRWEWKFCIMQIICIWQCLNNCCPFSGALVVWSCFLSMIIIIIIIRANQWKLNIDFFQWLSESVRLVLPSIHGSPWSHSQFLPHRIHKPQENISVNAATCQCRMRVYSCSAGHTSSLWPSRKPLALVMSHAQTAGEI